MFGSLFGGNRKERRRQRRAKTDAAYEEARVAMSPRDGHVAKDRGADVLDPAVGENARSDIWDIEPAQEAESGSPEIAEAEPAAVADGPSRKRRNRTRLIGFDTSDGDFSDPFKTSAQLQDTRLATRYPAGWLVVVEGPGRGHAFVLTSGMAQIGRGEGQAIQLDFGDNAISRDNHAAVVYDPADRSFVLGHGGKANIVRLNGKPVISNETLTDGDRITIGETTLALRTFCGEAFDWSDGSDAPKAEEAREDVAIA